GNTATASQQITVEDKTAPTLVGVPANITVECSAVPTAPTVTATDNCDANVNVTINEVRTNGSCPDSYTLTRTWTATDNCGNTATASQQITVEDKTAPVLVGVPANITVECSTVPTAPTVTATDNCDANVNVTLNEVRTNGSCPDSYTLTRTWTATDNCGNTATASQQITVEDKTAPTLVGVPANITVECSAVPTAPSVTATDNCDANVNVTLNEVRTNGSCPDSYTLTRTWTATDNCGNTATASQQITVEDKTAPTLVGVPANITVECSAVPTAPSVTATDNCDANVNVTLNEVRTNGSCPDSYTLTRTWTATDNCGNTATASQQITVEDKTAPVLVGVPANITVECSAVPTAPSVTATDNCDANVNVTLNEVRTNGSCPDSYTLTRTWTATDNCGNTATASQQITVEDKTAPTLVGVPANITVECSAVPTAPSVTATDNCDANVNVTLNEVRTNGSCPDSYTLTRTWTATDNCGNTATASQQITVEDKTAPTLVGVPANITVECSAVPTAPSVTATDNCDANVNVTINEVRTNGSCPDSYTLTRTWTATDNCGNTATASQQITVEDKTAPVLVGVPANITVECSAVPTAPSVTATDNCDANVNVTLNEVRTNGSCPDSYILTRTWTATDNCGNTATASQQITVEDKTAPVLVGVPANITVECSAVPTAPSVTATDNCDANVNVTINELRTNGSCPDSYVLTRTWTATDNCGNTATASQQITVEDKTAPVLTNISTNTAIRCGEAVPAPVNPIATDNCDANVTIVMNENRVNGSCSGSYRIVRVWTATDNCGNTTTASQEISVSDDAPPVLANVPTNITINCNDAIPAPANVTATDICDPNVRITSRDVRANGNCPNNFVITRIWTATDACGNTATASQTITAVDTGVPVLTNVPTDITLACDQPVPTAVNPSVSDNCDANPRISLNENRINGTCANSFRLIRTWTATDACGNTATASQTITVGDNEPPVLANIPANLTLNCNENLPIPALVTATDKCDPRPRIVMNDNTVRGACAGSYTIIRTWTATDACGNTASATQSISVNDNDAPVFANVPANVTANCGENVPAVTNPTITDNCDQNPRLTFNEVRQNGNCVGSYKLIRTWTATDACGNSRTATQEVQVGDNQPPTLSGVPANVTLRCDEPLPTAVTVIATDICDPNPRVTMNDNTIRGICAGSYTVIRTWTATDACGNSASASQTISVGDNDAPTFANVPANITVNCGSTIPAATNPSVSDNCDQNPRLTFNELRQNGSCVGSYKLIRTWTATDACGNSRTATQEVSVGDNEPPVLANVPANLTLNCNDNLPTGATVTATDNCDATPRITMNDVRVNGRCSGSYTITRTWTATDACGNTATASQTISVGDNTPPVLSNIPTSVTLNCNDNLPTVSLVTATDNCDANPRVVMNDNTIRGNCAGSFTIIRTWTATDACGNTATASQTISVGDNEAPVFANVPADITANCGTAIPNATNPTITDNCDANPRLSFVENRQNGTCTSSYILIRTWTATDNCGNSRTATQQVSVGDNQPPVLVNVPANITLNCSQSLPTTTGVYATDNCDLTPRVTMNDNTIRGNCSGSYTVIRTWTATDACGNTATASQTISVGDNEAPVFANVPTNVTVNCGGTVPAVTNPSVSDVCDANPRLTFNEVRQNGNCVGSYKLIRTWTATDACGNSRTATQEVSVGDNQVPVLSNVPANVTLRCDESLPIGSLVTATDICDPNPRVTMNDNTIRGNCSGSYTVIRTWTATDACGNTATASQTISVGDNEAPVFANVPTNVTVNCGGTVPAVTNPSVSDVCDANPRLTFNEVRQNGNCVGSYKLIRTWTATDACGNTRTATQEVSVGDNQAPVLSNVPANITLKCNDALPIGSLVTATDVCDPNPRVTMNDNTIRGNCSGSYTVIRTWTATDACGNTATASQTISVGDNEAPVFANVPTNVTVNCGGTVPAVTNPSVSDVCDANPRLTFTELRQNGNCAGSYKLIRTWTATDACGNTRTATQEVSVGDNQAPVLSNVPANVTLRCDESLPIGSLVTATDVCDPNPRVTMNDNTIRGNCSGSYTVIRIWTATDACGNTATASQTISVGDNEAPVFANVPTNVAVNCGGTVPAVTNPSVSDVCDANPRLTFNEVRQNGNCAGSYKLIRTWTATDACGNSRTATQEVSVGDNQAPVLSNIPPNVTLRCDESLPIGRLVTATDVCDPNPRVTMNDNTIRGNCSGSYTVIRTWTATDACGNTATASQTISVGDNEAPVFANVPTNVTINCGGTVPIVTNPSVSDVCDANPRLIFNEVRQNGNCVGSYKLIRTWTATDACGNTRTATQEVSVGDNQAPVLSNVPANITLKCNEALPIGSLVTATDICDPNPRVTMNDNTIRGNCSGSYTVIRTWTATDACGNTATASQTISVGDNEAPVFANVPTNVTINCGGTVPIVTNPSVSDVCDANPRLTFNEVRQNGNCIGSYKLIRTWTATDACGNTRTATQEVSVGDNQAPVLSNVPANITLKCNDALPIGSLVTATDVCDPNPRVTMNDNTIRGNCSGSYTVIRTWTATDACGNTATASQTISVGDNEAPVFANVPTNVTVNCGGTVPAVTNPSVSDVCDANPRLTFNEVRQNGNCVGSYKLIRTWTATDACGNSRTVSQEVSVGDNEAPVLSNVPANVTLNCGGTLPIGNLVRATDVCDPNPRITMNDVTQRGNCEGSYTVVRTWTATDACGNTATASQTISVGDNEAPVFANVPTNVTVNCGGTVPAVTNPSVSDVCDANPRLTFNEVRQNGNCVGSYKLIRTWTATDACGNTRTATQEVSVGDNAAPILTNVPASITLKCDENLPIGTLITATDVCDPNPRVVMQDVTQRGNCAGSYTVVRTWTATDACGNSATASQTISVGDNEAPTFSNVPTNVTVNCGGTPPNVVNPSVNDACDASPRLTFNELRQNGNCVGSYTLIRTWTATDVCGNSRTATQQVSIGDNQPPVLTEVPANVTLNCGGVLPIGTLVRANDICDPNPRVTMQDITTRGNCEGSYTVVRTWTATDACGNSATASQTISVGDNDAPTFSNVPVDATINCGGTVPSVVNPSISDICDANPRLTFVETRQNGNCASSYKLIRTWTATDACGNSRTAKQEISVGDNEKPELVGVPDNVTLNCGRSIPTPSVSARDNCDADVGVAFTERLQRGACVDNYTLTRTWTAVDACGNIAAKTQTITIRDDVNPELINVPQDITVNLTLGETVPPPPSIFATDNCDNDVNVTFREQRINGTCGYTLIRSWVATDNCSNRDALTQTITVIDGITVSVASVKPENCGGRNGSVTFTPLNLNFNWSDGSTSGSRNDLRAGTYNVTVSNSVGCVKVMTVTVGSECGCTAPVATVSKTDISCFSTGDGAATINVTNGALSEFKFIWTPNVSTTNQARGLSAGAYTVRIERTDKADCFTEVNFQITAPNRINVAEPLITKASCTSPTGKIEFRAISGTENWLYRWSSGDTGRIRDKVRPGTYTVTISDPSSATTCPLVKTVEVGTDNPLSTTFVINKQPVCGLPNGDVTLTTTGGSGQYTYSWGEGNRRFVLPAGQHTVTATDVVTGCQTTVTFILTNQSVEATLTMDTATAVTCNGASDGRINYTISNYGANFVQPAKVEIRNLQGNLYSNGSLSAGNYRISVKDANGCLAAERTFTVTQPFAMTANFVKTNQTCDSLGTISLIVSGGNSGYKYTWSDLGSQVNQPKNRENLTSGFYSVTITDAAGCIANLRNIQVKDSCVCRPPVIDSVSTVAATCGSSNGTATIVLRGGEEAKYSFSWSPNSGTANTIGNSRTGLAAGIYSVFIRLRSNPTCFTSVNIAVGNIEGPKNITYTTTPATCEQTNGSVTLNSTEGVDYLWIIDQSAAKTRSDLAAGFYQVQVTKRDAPDCPSVINVKVEKQNPMTATAAISRKATCGQQNGAATINIGGGTGSYTYSWGDGPTRVDLPARAYTVTVIDNNTGCRATSTFAIENEVTGTATITISSPVVYVNCFGEKNARINYNITYSPNFGVPPTIGIVDAQGRFYENGSLGVGNYCIVVRDVNGCLTGSQCFEVREPQKLQVIAAKTNKTCAIGGTITVAATGGNGGYTVTWADLTGTNQPLVRQNLNAGTYRVTVVDAKGCSAIVDTINIKDECPITVCALNANFDAHNRTCTEGGYIMISATGGTQPYTFDWLDLTGTNNGQNRFDLSAGTYSVIVTDAANCKDTLKNIIIKNLCTDTTGGNVCIPPTLAAARVIPSRCGLFVGSITMTVNTPVVYRWSPNVSNSNVASGLKAGIYTVKIANASDTTCFIEKTFVIKNQNGVAVGEPSITAATCGASNGKAVFPTMGYPLTYAWSDGGNGGTRSDLAKGRYAVTVSDPTGTVCEQIVLVEVGGNSSLTASATIERRATCGQANGQARLSVSGGSGNYTYSWGSSATRSDLRAGAQNVTITDNTTGCTTVLNFTMTNEPAGQATITMPSLVVYASCAGNRDASIAYELSYSAGFTLPSTVEIRTTTGVLAKNDSLAAGRYILNVYDANGCLAASQNFEVREPQAMTVNQTTTAANCVSKGSISLDVTGGSGVYRFNWSDLSGTNQPQNRISIISGNYTVTVSDSRGCNSILTNIIVGKDSVNCNVCPSLVSVRATNKTCTEGGKITLTTIGGLAPHTFDWLDLAGTNNVQDRTGLAAGTYTVVVIDAKNCRDTLKNIRIIDDCISNTCNVTATATPVNKTCTEGGKITLNVSGGSEPYRFDWADVAGASNTPNRTALAGGTYSVTITDSRNCTFTLNNIVIRDDCSTPPCTMIAQAVATPKRCSGDGSIALNVSGGTTPYTFRWADLTGTNQPQNRTGIAVGTYRVTVTDARNCDTIIQNIVVKDSAINCGSNCTLNVTVTPTPKTCTEGGKINVQIAGGTPPYRCIWSDLTGSDHPENRTGLSEGLYTVIILDAAGCRDTFSNISIVNTCTTTVCTMKAAVTTTAKTCQTGGTISINVTGGTAPYRFTWSDLTGSLQPQNRSNLAAGTYRVTVNDATTCDTVVQNIVVQDEAINCGSTCTMRATVSATAKTCQSAGSIAVSVSGGTTPYTFRWSDLSGTNQPQSRSNLAAGTYRVTISDASGSCDTVVQNIIVKDEAVNCNGTPCSIVATATPTAKTCTEGGKIAVTAVGGTAPYTYDWLDVVGTNDGANRSNLAVGSYTVIVKDSLGCKDTVENILIINTCTTTPCTLIASATPTAKTCTEGGKITLNIAGSTTPYTFRWADLSGTNQPQNRSNLAAGAYRVTVSDANGTCDTTIQNIVVKDSALNCGGVCNLDITVLTTNKTCTEGGKITVTTTGGTAPFTFDWSDLAGNVDPQNRSNLADGVYTIIVTDSQGCKDTVQNIRILNTCTSIPCTLVASALASPKTCQTTGSIALTVNGGTVPYTYRWSDLTSTGQPKNRTELPAGTYHVTVTDGLGCDTIISNIIVRDEAINCGGNNICNLSVSATPTARTCAVGGSIAINVRSGISPLVYKWSDLSGANQPSSRSNLAAGAYRLTITDANNCDTVIQNIAVKDDCIVTPCTLMASATPTAKTCTEGGKITVATTGGTAPFTFDWLDLAGTNNGQNRTGLAVGSYTVVVTDGNGCKDTVENISVLNNCGTIPCTLQVSVSASPKTCTEGGKITVATTGGTTPYTFRWSDLTGVNQPQNRTNLPSGTYRVTVSDNNGCDTIIQNIIVRDEAVNCGTTCQLTATVLATPKTCTNNGGSLAVSVDGGQAPYTYRWADLSGTNQSQTRTALAAGSYRLTVTDARGCDTIFQNLVVRDEAVNCVTCRLSVAVSASPKTCNLSGSINLVVGGGVAPYTFRWSDLTGNVQPQNRTGLNAGTYRVTILDNNGCDTTVQNIIVVDQAVNCGNVPCTMSATALPTPISCTVQGTPFGEGGKIVVQVTGGLEPYVFDWLDMNGTNNPQNRTNLTSGQYTVIVTDARACKDTISNITIANDCNSTICTPPTIANVAVVNATCGNSNGSISLTTSSRVVFTWSPNVSASATATNLSAGIYKVKVAKADTLSCFVERQIVVNNINAPVVATPLIRPATCAASNGLVRFANADWQYVWSDGGTGFERNNLAAGSYQVIVSDPSVQNCPSIVTVVVPSQNTLAATATITRKATCGSANGVAILNVTGGTGNYTYSWGLTATRNNLSAGIYTVTITDNTSGCQTTTSVNMTEEVANSATITIAEKVVYTRCVGDANGRVSFTIAPANLGAVIKNASGVVVANGALSVGAYSIEVRDNSGCLVATEGFEVKNPVAIQAAVSASPKTCGANGSIVVNATGGTGTLSYRWNDGETLANRTNVAAGTYWLTITDASGCTVVLNNIIVKNEAVNCGGDTTCRIVAVSTVTNRTCTEGGKIEVTASGGTAPYTYDWLDIAGLDNLKTRTQLDSGRFTVIVRDSLGCADTLRNIIVQNTCFPYDTCPAVYDGDRVLYVSECSDKAEICTNLDYRAFDRYQVLANNREILFEPDGCSQDTLYSYSYFSMRRLYPVGPWDLASWTVNGRSYSAQIENLAMLVDSMNRWDRTGNWQLEPQNQRVMGGDNRNVYGAMRWTKDGRVIARMEPNLHYVPNQLKIRLPVGSHVLEFRDTVNGCRDSFTVTVSCRPPVPQPHSSRIDTLIYVSDMDTICLSSNVRPSSTTLTNICSSNYRGYVGYVIDDRTDCIPLLGVSPGRDSLCIRRCYSNGLCDTTTIVVTVKAYPTPSDTSCVQITPDSVYLSTICGTPAQLCTNLYSADTVLYRIMVDGRPYKGGFGTCSNDSLASYSYFSLIFTNPYGPWELESWRVGNTIYRGLIPNIRALVDSMNRWDRGGNWVLEQTSFAIKGGVTGRDYGQMLWSRNGVRVAELEANYNYSIRALSMNLEPGLHKIVFTNLLRGCSDTISAEVHCRQRGAGTIEPTVYLDTTVLVGKTLEYCLPKVARATPNETSLTIQCAPKGRIEATINDRTDCVILRGLQMGNDTMCLFRCDASGICDTIMIRVKVVKPQQQTFKTVVHTVSLGTDSSYCVDRSLMVGRTLTLRNVCEPNTVDKVNFILNGLCVNYLVDGVGSDTACLVLCDEFGNCDTTQFIVNVKQRGARLLLPIAVPDKVTISYGATADIEVMKNDSTFNQPAQVELVSQPRNGSITVNPATGIVTYKPKAGDCEPRDSFIYALVNALGSDTTLVSIEILCDDVVVFSGFSPNDDGKNDAFTIMGLEKYQNAKLLVFNRWGNQVFEATDYKNDWKGTFDNKPLPDGTYFWILDLGGGKTMSGYVQILR
ncbi:MAG: gliding motility-associated C-terminal domain-containing protein, partial [Saprospiraceae bacterium]|nr:gliding motility-associated C-terminal domain-containing protein [Saprospiraceae bacterium]